MFCGITVGIAVALTIIIWTILTEWIIGPWLKWSIFGLSFLVIGGLAYLAKMSAMSSFSNMSSGMAFNRGGPNMGGPGMGGPGLYPPQQFSQPMAQQQYQQQQYQPQQYQQPIQQYQQPPVVAQALPAQALPPYPNTAQPFQVRL